MPSDSDRDQGSTAYPMVGERVRMSDGGRVVIPLQFRDALGVKPGDDLVVRMENDSLIVCSVKEAMRRSQALVRKYVAKDRSLVDELIAERKREAERG